MDAINIQMNSDENDAEKTDDVDDIIKQLKNVPSVIKKTQEIEENLNKRDIQQFVIDYSAKLIKSATESVEYVKDIVQAAPTPEDISALSELIGSTSTALDILNKMSINDNKIDNSIRIKQMDIDSKQTQLETKVATTMLLTREEVMKKLIEDSNKIKKAKTIEI
jgi:hypothetical protein